MKNSIYKHTNTKKNTIIKDTYEYGTMRTKTKYIYAIRWRDFFGILWI